MITVRHLIITTFFSFGFLLTSAGQNIILKQTCESGIYKRGEKIDVKLFLQGESTDSVFIKIQKM